MKIHKGNVYLYVCIVILPVFIIGFFYFNQILKENDIKRKNDAKWIGSIYQKNWDQFIGETITSLKVLSLSAEENIDELDEIQPLLNQVHQSDPRYGALYLLDGSGKFLKGSDSEQQATNFSKLAYIQEVIKTKDTIISSHQETLRNNQKILGLATPVIDEKNHLTSILVAQLRIDYMKNLMNVLTPETKLFVVNGEGNTILEMNVNNKSIINDNNWITVPMDRLPWTIKVKVADRNIKEIGKTFGKALFITLVITHVLFLLMEYILLRRSTKRERKENEVQKLELVGTLAASTAHEIRNPLTGVKGLLQLLSEKYTDTEDRYYFDVIDSELNRINEIVSEFLILGKPTAQINSNINITETLHELKTLIISEGNSHNVECIWNIPFEAVIVRCVKDQLKQVILNITKNAFESMESSGFLKVNLCILEDFCKLEIIDTGKGISKENLDKIFRPFFTSKETGTGLGLVICQRIINSFGGKIHINSTEAVGTTVEIILPTVKNKRAQ